MKRFAVIAGLLLILSSCGAPVPEDTGKQDAGKINIVATIYPEYDWVREIAGDRLDAIDLTLLTEGDLHSYQPSAKDIAAIGSADLFIYIGGDSDEWVEDALRAAPNENRRTINLMESIRDSLREEELVEGMQEEKGEEEEAEPEYDEHIWLSLRTAEECVRVIGEALEEADPGGGYEEGAEAYIEKLRALDRDYEKAVREGKRRTILFAGRFPFRYMAEDYGLTYFAAFPGCSAESEASFETLQFLTDKTEELGLPYIAEIDGETDLLEAILRNLNDPDRVRAVTFVTMQNMSGEMVREMSYLDIMRTNLLSLSMALS